MIISIRKKRKLRRFILIALLVIIILLTIFISLTKAFYLNLNKEQEGNIDAIEDKSIQENIIQDENSNKTENNEKIDEKDNIEEESIKRSKNNKEIEFNSDVAFIGDSRTKSFLMYSGLNNVTDYTNIGLMVDTAITKKFITNNKGQKITILEDLKNRNINTVYIMLGINELGWVYSSIFIKYYEELINSIKRAKPDCEIILQSIIPVTKTKSDSDSIYNNKRINEYNALIKELAERIGVKYINLVPTLTDENGNLPEDASPDGVHLNKEYCLKWLECLKNN